MAHLYNQKYYPSVAWIDASYGALPPSPVVGGTEHLVRSSGVPVYVGRIMHDGDTIIGKVCPESKGCYVPYRGQQIHSQHYQVLCNPRNCSLAWVRVHNGEMPTGAIIGGQEKDGTSLYIGRAMHDGSMCVGKINPHLRTLYYPLHQEHLTKSFEVLVARALNASHSAY